MGSLSKTNRLFRNTAWLLAASVLPAAERPALLLDRSGTMRPYYDNGVALRLARAAARALEAQGPVDVLAFGDRVTPIASTADVLSLPLAPFTCLDRAIDAAMERGARLVLMITDNIQDQAGAPEAGNTEVFYQRLRAAAVHKVAVFPITQPPPLPGLVVYAIQIGASGGEAYENTLAAFAQAAGDLVSSPPLRMKPLDQGTMEVRVVRAPSAAEYADGARVREQVEIRFHSLFEHIGIERGDVRVIDAVPGLDSESLMRPEKRVVSVTPRIVRQLGAGVETGQVYVLDIDLGQVKLRKDLGSLWKAAWGNPVEEADLRIDIRIEVPEGSFNLQPAFLERFHAGTLDQARAGGRIYALDQLPRLMSVGTTSIRTQTPLKLRFRYPWWPALLWIGGFAVALLVAALAARAAAGLWSGRARRWTVRAESERGAPLPAGIEGPHVLVLGDVVGAINGGRFIPAAAYNAPEIQIKDGLRVSLSSARNRCVVVFESVAAPAARAVESAIPAPERR